MGREDALRWWLDTRDKPALLWAFLQHWAADCCASFEGNLQRLGVLELPGATQDETDLLKRQTISPRQDFVILPISQETLSALKRCLSGAGVFNDGGALEHVQIVHQGRLVLGAYDHFHWQCVVARDPVPLAMLEELVSLGVLRSYRQVSQGT